MKNVFEKIKKKKISIFIIKIDIPENELKDRINL